MTGTGLIPLLVTNFTKFNHFQNFHRIHTSRVKNFTCTLFDEYFWRNNVLFIPLICYNIIKKIHFPENEFERFKIL